MNEFVYSFFTQGGVPAVFIILMLIIIVHRRSVSNKLSKVQSQSPAGKASKIIFLASGLPLLIVGVVASLTPNSYAPILGIPMLLLGLVLTITSFSIDRSIQK